MVGSVSTWPKLLLGLAGGHHYLLGDDAPRQRHSQILGPGAHAFPSTTQTVTHLLEVHDVAVDDSILGNGSIV